MEDREKSEQEMVQYLLGQLSAEDQLRIESSYFADPERFNQLQAVEFDLIEGYVCSKLSVADRARFEEHYLTSPNRREQVEFFQTLTQVLSLESDQPVPVQAPVRPSPIKRDAEPGSSWWQSLLALFHGPRLVLGASFAAALLLLIGGSVWQLNGIRQSPGEIAKTEGTGSPIPPNGADGQNEPKEQSRQTDQASNAIQPEPNDQADRATGQANDRAKDQANGRSGREREPVQPKPESAPAPKAVPATVSFTWTIPGLRDFNTSGNIPRNLRIPSGAELVQLIFKPSADAGYSRYRVTLKTLDDQDVWSRNDVKISKSRSETVLTLAVPVKAFQNGSYSVVVSANNKRGEPINIAEYHIEVTGVENR